MARRKKTENVIEEEILLEDSDDILEDDDLYEDDEEYDEEELEEVMALRHYDDEELKSGLPVKRGHEPEDVEAELRRRKIKKSKQRIEEETDAARTLKPGSKPDTRAGMMNGVVQAMDGMSGGDMVKFFELVMAQAAKSAATINPGAAAANKGSVEPKGTAVKEDLEALFGDDESLSEEFKDKLTTIFEAALQTRVAIVRAELEEEYEEALAEQVEEISEQLENSIDKYMDYMAEEWLAENQVAVDNSLKSELTESFMKDLGQLCKQYNFDLPEGEDDIVESLTVKVAELEEKLNDVVDDNISLAEENESLVRNIMIESAADEVSPLHYEKFKSLAESIEYDGDVDKFANKLGYIKEGFFNKKAAVNTNLITEEIAGNDEEYENGPKFIDPAVKQIYESISRTSKR